MKKMLVWTGHISLLVTAILAVVFFRERVLYVDPGQQVFEMINEGGYKVFVSRYSMMINQTFPLIAIKLGLPLKWIILTYSLSFVVIYYLSFVISVHAFKNIAAGLGIAFVPLLVRQAFGHSISEAWLGIAYSAIFYAMLNAYEAWHKRGILFTILFYLIIMVVIAINYFIHPITLFTVGFSIGFTLFNTKKFRSPHIYIITLIVLAMYSYKFFFPTHQHEENFFAGLKMADQLLPQIFKLPILGFFSYAFFKIYILLCAVLLVTGFFYLREKKWMPYVFVILYCMAFIVVASLAFYKQDAHFAKESRLMPLIFMAMIPFAEIIKDKKRNWALLAFLIGILGFGYANLVYQVKKVHTHRIKFYEQLIADVKQYPERKFYSHAIKDRISAVNSWGMATETLLLSSMEGKDQSRTIYFFKPDENIREDMLQPICTYVWVPWYFYWSENYLNKKYFDLQCTAYREIENPEAR